MRHIISSIRDVRTWVDNNRHADDDRDLNALAQRVYDDAHAAGLRCGQDWTEWLASYNLLPTEQ